MSTKKFIVVFIAVISLFSVAANAEIVTFKFSGSVTYTNGTLATAVTGSPITGIVSYDTSVSGADLLTGYSSYSIPSPFVISASVGQHTIMAKNLNVSIWDNYGGNVEDMVWMLGGSVFVDGNSYPDGAFGFVVASGPGNTKALTSTALPSCLDVTAFDAGSTLSYGVLQSDGGSNGQILQFSIDSIISTQKCKYARKQSVKKEKNDK